MYTISSTIAPSKRIQILSNCSLNIEKLVEKSSSLSSSSALSSSSSTSISSIKSFNQKNIIIKQQKSNEDLDFEKFKNAIGMKSKKPNCLSYDKDNIHVMKTSSQQNSLYCDKENIPGGVKTKSQTCDKENISTVKSKSQHSLLCDKENIHPDDIAACQQVKDKQKRKPKEFQCVKCNRPKCNGKAHVKNTPYIYPICDICGIAFKKFIELIDDKTKRSKESCEVCQILYQTGFEKKFHFLTHFYKSNHVLESVFLCWRCMDSHDISREKGQRFKCMKRKDIKTIQTKPDNKLTVRYIL